MPYTPYSKNYTFYIFKKEKYLASDRLSKIRQDELNDLWHLSLTGLFKRQWCLVSESFEKPVEVGNMSKTQAV